jgi:uncharacterized protein
MSEQRRGIGRRTFLRLGGGGLLGASAAGRVEPQEWAGRSPPASAPAFIVDSHNHWGGTEQWVEEMVRTYRAHRAMVCSIGWIRDLEMMNEATANYPDVFIPYGRVDLDDPNSVRDVERFRDHGFVGMKFHSPRRDWDDPAYYQVYRLCEQLGLHMLFHTGVSSRRAIDRTPRWGSAARMRPMMLDTLARQFPGATIQGAHFGNPWYEEAAEAARWNPNLFFDVTGSTLYKLRKLNQLHRLGECLWWADWPEGEENPHTLQGGPTAWAHVVFGTDEGPSGLAGNIERFQEMMDVNRVPAVDQENMWGLTLARILRIDPQTRRRTG